MFKSCFSIENQCQVFLLNEDVSLSDKSTKYTSGDQLRRLLNLHKENVRPYLGVIVKLEQGGLLLAIGPYFGNRHEDIVRSLMRDKKIVIEGVLWGGELLIAKKARNLTVYGANETSGFLNDLYLGKSSLRNNFDPWAASDYQDLNHAFVLKSNVGFLDFFRNHDRFTFIKDYLPTRFSEDELHILPGLAWNNQNIRHDLGNQVSTIIAWMEMLSRETTLVNYDMKFIKKVLFQLNAYVKSYILWENLDRSNKHAKETLDKFSEFYNKFSDTKKPFEVLSPQDWHSFAVVSRQAFEIIFNSAEKPILFELKVSDSEE